MTYNNSFSNCSKIKQWRKGICICEIVISKMSRCSSNCDMGTWAPGSWLWHCCKWQICDTYKSLQLTQLCHFFSLRNSSNPIIPKFTHTSQHPHAALASSAAIIRKLTHTSQHPLLPTPARPQHNLFLCAPFLGLLPLQFNDFHGPRVTTATETSRIVIGKCWGHVVSWFTGPSLCNRNPSPNCHYNPRITCIGIHLIEARL